MGFIFLIPIIIPSLNFENKENVVFIPNLEMIVRPVRRGNDSAMNARDLKDLYNIMKEMVM